MRMIFNYEDMSMNLAKRRVTDLKGNARVILPRRAKNFECRGTFSKYMEEKCDRYGNQVSNLNASELKGLKSLKSRIKMEKF